MQTCTDKTLDLLAAAYVRGVSLRTGIPVLESSLLTAPLDKLSDEALRCIYRAGQAAELKLYRFKDHHDLPRVQKVMSFLRAVCPESLLDVGSGRGVFLFPFLRNFPGVPVTSLDILEYRTTFLDDVRRGGIGQLTSLNENLCTWRQMDHSFDVVTLLEVLEHIPDVDLAIRAAVRLARRYVVVTVPSKPDDNPEHIHLLTKEILTDLFVRAGCTRLKFDGVPGHLFLVASVR